LNFAVYQSKSKIRDLLRMNRVNFFIASLRFALCSLLILIFLCSISDPALLSENSAGSSLLQQAGKGFEFSRI
jgi:hypothetical protein